MDGQLSVAAEPVHRPSSNPVFRFRIRDRHGVVRSVIAKWAPIYPENNEGATEFLHYEAFAQRHGKNAAWRCPVPLAFLADENVLLTEGSAGEPLRNVLTWMRTGGLWRAVALCGEWLAAFHSSPRRTGIDAASAWAMLHKAGYTAADGNGADPDSRRISGTCSMGRVHRDFGPGNILAKPDHVTVLDAACNELLPQMMDIANFTAYL